MLPISILSIFLLFISHIILAASFCLEEDGLNEKFLPLTSAAAGLPLNAAGYAVDNFGEGAYMVTDGIYQALVLVSEHEGVIVVDCPPTMASKLQYAIGNITAQPVKYFVYSHSHGDHVGGAYLFANQSGVKSVAHENTAYALSYVHDPLRPIPTETFRVNHTIHLGNQTLELSFYGPSHDFGNIFIYAPIQKVLMVVDTVYPGWVPFGSLAESIYIPGWFAAHDQILEYDFDYYVGGHLGRAGTRSDILIAREYIHDLYDNCVAAIQESATSNTDVGLATIGATVMENNPGNAWAEFRVYLDLVSDLCYNTTNEKWLGVLSAQDVYGFSHASKMVESLRLDYDVLGPLAVQ
jgi:glyoxylase-like metal-dependent hydrolase (beta-lactamase superfamily II)